MRDSLVDQGEIEPISSVKGKTDSTTFTGDLLIEVKGSV